MMNDGFGDLLSDMLDCARNQLGERGLANLPGRSFVTAGDVAWDDCCDGQLWVRLIHQIPAGTTTQSRPVRTNCGVSLWKTTIGVGIVRCAATVDDQGQAPAAGELTADAMGVCQDMLDLDVAIRCCMADLAPLTMVRWDALGPQGGCVGGEWTVTVVRDLCGC